jgi:hypothetical protein
MGQAQSLYETDTMPTAPPSVKPPPPPAPRVFSPMAGFLSYLVPGLGQISQGRVAKGVLFLVCIYTLFFYGMYLGSGTVTYKGTTYTVNGNVYLPNIANPNNTPLFLQGLPATVSNLYNRPQFLGQFWVGVAAWPAVWQYLNYDERQPNGETLFGQFERTPREDAINAVQTSGDKSMELGWVYTVIAGVLNIMVIYDACAGPAFVLAGQAEAAPPRKAVA